MTRNEQQSWEELIEPELLRLGWDLELQHRTVPGRINVSGDKMHTPSKEDLVDCMLCYRDIRLAVMEVKVGRGSLDSGRLQASKYADKLSIQFSIVANGADWILTDNKTGESESLEAPPDPEEILKRMGVEIDWERWGDSLSADYYGDQKNVRYYQKSAISKTLFHFGQDHDRALLVMAAGTGKRFTIFQLIWKMMNGGSLSQEHVLYLTDSDILKDKAYQAFSGFSDAERVEIDTETVSKGQYRQGALGGAGKVFFANYQMMDSELDGQKLFEHFDADFFDLVVLDECYRSGFGDWFGVLEHFSSAMQLGLTVAPHEQGEFSRKLSEEERRRDTHYYFGKVIYQYSLAQAVEDGFLVPHFLERRYLYDYNGGLDGWSHNIQEVEKHIREYDRVKEIAEDLWSILGTQGLRDEKTIVFCVDETHAALMAEALRQKAGTPENPYAVRFTPAERSLHNLEREFALVGSSHWKVAVTVDMGQASFGAPDVRNIVFTRPVRSAVLYQQMKAWGTRLCEETDKRYFTIFDYSNVSGHFEDIAFDDYPVRIGGRRKKYSTVVEDAIKTKASDEIVYKFSDDGIELTVVPEETGHFVTFDNKRKIYLEDYLERSREFVQAYVNKDINQLLDVWINKSTRQELRKSLASNNIYLPPLRCFLDQWSTDDVDFLAKIGFDLVRVPTRRQRVDRLWGNELANLIDAEDPKDSPEGTYAIEYLFWQFALDHYAQFGIDHLEQADTYRRPEFGETFGSFQRLTTDYGGVLKLKEDLEVIKKELYVAPKIWDTE